MCGAIGVTIQPHQILRLPHRMTRLLDRRHIWNVIYNARSNRCHHPNLTKYCACHTEWLACLVVVIYATSFTMAMRGATGVTIQPHQILRLPRKMTRLLYGPHTWNVISNARSNRCHYPTSPNTAPATKNHTARFQRVRLGPSLQQNPGKIPVDWALDTSQVLGGHIVRQGKAHSRIAESNGTTQWTYNSPRRKGGTYQHSEVAFLPAPLRSRRKVKLPKCLGVEVKPTRQASQHRWIALAGPMAVNIFRKLSFWVVATSQSDHWNLFTALWNWRYCTQHVAWWHEATLQSHGLKTLSFKYEGLLLFGLGFTKKFDISKKLGTSTNDTYFWMGTV